MNNLDYALVAIIVLGVLYGLSRGVLRIITSVLSLVLGIIVAASWFRQVGGIITKHSSLSLSIANAIGYVIVFLLVALIVEYAGRRIVALVQAINLNWFDRLGGLIIGLILGAALAGVTVMVLTAVMPADWPELRESRFAPRVLGFDQELLSYIPPEAMQLFNEKRNELTRYWQRQNQSPVTNPSRSASGT